MVEADMASLPAAALLQVWESSRRLTRPQQARALLTAAWRGVPDAEWERLSVGERDERLLALREQLFGPRLQCLCRCPACDEELESEFRAADLRPSKTEPTREEFALDCEDHAIRFRLPTNADLLSLTPQASPAVNRLRLFEHCVLEARRDGRPIAARDVPESVINAVSNRMAKADPAAALELALTCPACRHRWHSTFDVVSFLWTEVDAWAMRMLREVHALATAYGWSEAEILALSPLRRQAYLEMIGA